MELSLFLSPVPESIINEKGPLSLFSRNITVNTGGTIPDLKDFKIALIGLEESRGLEDETDLSNASEMIRKKLYNLRRGYGSYDIIDLGNIVNGIDHEETIKRIQAVSEYLISISVLPVFFGGTHDLDFGQYLAYEGLEKLISVVNVDASLDMEEEGSISKRHLHEIMMHMPNFLFHYSHLAYQGYLTESRVVDVLKKLYFDEYSLGSLRDNFREIEPVVRDADMLSFDISAIRRSDSPGNPHSQPFGLTGEEACQISWYAGHSDKLSSVGFYEYYPFLDDDNGSSAMIIATMIWYFIEGFYHRKDEQNFRPNDYTKYLVTMPSSPESITFFKSNFTEKWWLEIPVSGKKSVYKRNYIVPCTYADYETATKGEVPERYINSLAKRP